jgi:hypothetical protein
MSAIVVSGLVIYPVKGARGIARSHARAGDRGFALDRRWMLVDEAGVFITQRTFPRLALLETALEADALVLRAPGFEPLRLPLVPEGKPEERVEVWSDRCRAIDVGAEAAGYLGAFLGTRCKLVFMPDEVVRRVDGRYAKRKEKVGFADGFPYLLASESSLADLNGRLEVPLPMDRFRPNIIVRGAPAWAEDDWETLAVGSMRFHVLKPCSRCPVTTVDQATGIMGKEPLATMATFRKKHGKVYFAQNMVADAEGEVRVGDAVVPLEPGYA